MAGSHTDLFILLSALLTLSMTFRINFSEPYFGPEGEMFGFKVLQLLSGQEKRIIVSAPLRENSTGGIYICDHNLTECRLLQTQGTKTKYAGIQLFTKSSAAEDVVCCGVLDHEHSEKFLQSDACHQYSNILKGIANVSDTLHGCKRRDVDVVFLFDGSSSLDAKNFKMTKQLITAIMEGLSSSAFQFAAVQFSKKFRTVFTFKDYQNGSARSKLLNEIHMNSLTNTYSAINYTLINLFSNLSSGVNPGAVKILIIITDGDPSDRITDVLKHSDELNVMRIVVGIGDLKISQACELSSGPRCDFLFYFDYRGLGRTKEDLVLRIQNIQWSEMSCNEMSPTELDNIYSWGTFNMGFFIPKNWFQPQTSTVEANIPGSQLDSNLHFAQSIVIGRKMGTLLLFLGTTGSSHNGKVIFLQKSMENWTKTDELLGEQRNSFFGGVLCSLDVDSDDETDFLIVGAPLFDRSSVDDGVMFVYNISAQLSLVKAAEISESSQGRFAASVSSISDLNGDGLRDVSVGSPMEDEGRGAVYIYLGDIHKGVQPQFSQRISAEMISPKLRQFGLSAHGEMDMDGDGLTDLVVGGRGAVVLLRSNPVVQISSILRFQNASKIFTCGEDRNKHSVGDVSVCFNMTELTKSRAGLKLKVLNLSYSLDMDSKKEKGPFFSESDKIGRSLNVSIDLPAGISCYNHTIYTHRCEKDLLPVVINLTSSLTEDHQSGFHIILNADSQMETNLESCEEDHLTTPSFQDNQKLKPSTLTDSPVNTPAETRRGLSLSGLVFVCVGGGLFLLFILTAALFHFLFIRRSGFYSVLRS